MRNGGFHVLILSPMTGPVFTQTIQINPGFWETMYLPTLPSQKPKDKSNPNLESNLNLREGWVGHFPETLIDPNGVTCLLFNDFYANPCPLPSSSPPPYKLDWWQPQWNLRETEMPSNTYFVGKSHFNLSCLDHLPDEGVLQAIVQGIV